MQHPDPKKHQIISFVKSGVRVLGSVAAMIIAAHDLNDAIVALALFYGIAELIGVYEELV